MTSNPSHLGLHLKALKVVQHLDKSVMKLFGDFDIFEFVKLANWQYMHVISELAEECKKLPFCKNILCKLLSLARNSEVV